MRKASRYILKKDFKLLFQKMVLLQSIDLMEIHINVGLGHTFKNKIF